MRRIVSLEATKKGGMIQIKHCHIYPAVENPRPFFIFNSISAIDAWQARSGVSGLGAGAAMSSSSERWKGGRTSDAGPTERPTNKTRI